MSEESGAMPGYQEMTFGQRLRRERESRQWTQTQLSIEAVGDESLVVSIQRWETTSVRPRSQNLEMLIKAFGKPPERWGTGILKHWYVPFLRNQYFTGREAMLQRLHHVLDAGTTLVSSGVCAISGLGGIGKTQTALEYAHRYGSEYEVVMWMQASSPDILLTDAVKLGLAVGALKHEETDQGRVASAMTRWLSECGPWLLIFDNVDDLAVVSPYFPYLPRGAILLTTRLRITGYRMRSVQLEKMSREEGITFLVQRIMPDTIEPQKRPPQKGVVERERKAASDLYDLMDGLPLALDQAGAYMKAGTMSLTEYLDLYTLHRKELLQERGRAGVEHPETVLEHPEAVATTWSLSFQHVERQNLAAAELLWLCSFLSPDAIPEELIRKGAKHFPPSLQQAATLDGLAINQLMITLAAYSLLTRDGEEKTFSIHRLVQAVVQDMLEKEMRQTWAERAMLAVNEAFPGEPFVEWTQCERLIPHVHACLPWIEQKPTLAASALLDKAGSFLRELGRYEDAKRFLEVAISIRERYAEAEDLLATSLSNLAGLLSYQGKIAEAIQLVERAYAIRERVLGEEHFETGTSLKHLALLSMQRGDLDQTEALLARVLVIYSKHLDPDHLSFATIRANLAVLYEDQGRYREAEQENERALSIYEQHMNPTHPAIARAKSNLGLALWRLGEYERARTLLLQALTLQESEVLDAAYSLTGLAEVAREQGEYTQAEQYYRQVLAIREEHLDENHPDRIAAIEGLADVYREQKRYAEAAERYQFALHLWEQHSQHFGPEALHLTRSLTGLAHLAREQGQYEEAEQLYRRALRIHESSAKAQHPDVAETLVGLAHLLALRGKRDDAMLLYARALSIREQTLGAHHPKTRAIQAFQQNVTDTGS